jgi:hypothetical protein
MTNRTIEIDGVTLEVERGVEPPPLSLRGREKSPFRRAVESLNPGESAVFPMTPEEMQAKSSTLNVAGKAQGCKYVYRAEGNKSRVFCLGTLNGKTTKPKATGTGW